MKTVAIICEYNPLHLGHKFHIDSIKKEFGDCAVVAIMSSNFVQRGDASVLDKYSRAKSAVLAGADLVLELPFPYSFGSAEYFAKAGVFIASAIGVCDTLSFGSECGSIDKLKKAAEILDSSEFKRELAKQKKDNPGLGHMHHRYEACRTLFGESFAESVASSNNILALEYIKAAKSIRANLDMHTVKREGDAYNDILGEGKYVSATFIREKIKSGEDISKYIPHECMKLYLKKEEEGMLGATLENLEQAILSFFRLAEPKELLKYAEMTSGLEYRLCKSAKKAISIKEFFDLAASKKYTNARIRRAVISCITGVREADFKHPVPYTTVLAASKQGQVLLKQMKRSSRIPVLTKPADRKKLDINAMRFAALSDKAEALYTLALSKVKASDIFMKASPFITEI